MELDIASKSLKRDDLSNVESIYNVITKDDLKNIYSNIDIIKYLKLIGVENEEYYSIVDINNYKAFNSYLTNENLDMLKEYVRFKIIECYADYLSMDYFELVSELENKLLGTNKELDIEEKGKEFIKKVFSKSIDEEYIEKFNNEEKVNYLKNIINDITDYYKKNISSITWMSDNTKVMALKKIESLNVNIAIKDLNNYDKNYKVSGDSLIDNIIKMNESDLELYLNILKNNTKQKVYNETSFNAYYNPQDNSINFPISFMYLLDLDKSYYENLGTVGMIIAHEITHAIDNNGAKFDYLGNLNKWWEDEDYQKFNELTKKVEEYYNNYSVKGIDVNGKLTVGENIADLGSVNIISKIAKEKGASKDELKSMFSSFAHTWASRYTYEYLKLLMLTDVHSPDSVRVNATLQSCDIFYEAYDIKKNDKMYLPKEKRVSIW